MSDTTAMSPGTRVTLIGAGANVFLSAIKFVGGIFGNSTALVADAVHSISDLVTDVIVLLTHRIGQMPRDEDHPYGHGRAETIGSTVVGVFIVAAGMGLAYEGAKVIASGVFKNPKIIAVVMAALSIVIKEWLYHYTRSAGKKANSPSLMANAWHHRSDAISSIAALVGITGAMLGVPMMDPIAAIAVAFMIMKVGYDISAQGIRDLMDTALSEEMTAEIRNIIEDVPGVIESHDLRTRRIGGEILMDVHIQVGSDLTVSEGHKIAESVRRKLINSIVNVEDVLVHVDAEDDSYIEPLYQASREELKRIIQPIVGDTEGVLRQTNLRVHYLRGKTFVDLFVEMDRGKTVAEAGTSIEALKQRLEAEDRIDEARIFLDVNGYSTK